ncbi:MAG: hypothetical protein BGO78_00740 [Chloroflexi bacterium 44-23]|nr:MAG: hypothetical protein BGO78_00740 [Chloroflexi bacterium 44-23]
MIPDWTRGAVFYQIFPDRFANGDLNNDPANIQPWGSTPTNEGFQGGDLAGIIEKIDYLVDLGINAVYLNPIFLASSNHRYNTSDYFQIDPKLGDIKDFQRLIEKAHKNGLKIILDGVFNHTGRSFFAFADILENGEKSPFKDWYYINHFPVDAYSPGKAKDYIAWWDFKSLPKLNTGNPAVQKYIFSVARYWISLGVDGWRLDVPNEIDDDSFWAEFRRQVKEENPNAFLLGEIWEVAPRWLNDDHFDSLMNYPLREWIINFLLSTDSAQVFHEKLTNMWSQYPPGSINALYNLLGSHDTERIMTALHKSIDLVKLAFLVLLTLPGVPAIYYGDEIGLSGGKDPANRKAFVWNPVKQNRELLSWVKKLIQFRNIFQTLQMGSYIMLSVENNPDILAYIRRDDNHTFVVVINRSSSYENIVLNLPHLYFKNGSVLNNLLGEETYKIEGSNGHFSLSVPPRTGFLLH